jgi:PA14 domain
VADSGDLDTPQWVVPDNALTDGSTYYWQAIAWDSYQAVPGNFSPVYSFKVDLRNGKDSTQAYDAMGPVSVDLATGNLTTSAKTHSIAALGGSLGVGLDYNSPQRSRPGVVAEYFNSAVYEFAGPNDVPGITRVEPNLENNWASNSPYIGKITQDWFKARWTGYFTAPSTGDYYFGGNHDDRMAVTVNNQQNFLYDEPGCYSGACYEGFISLTAGQTIPINLGVAVTI